MSLHLQTRKTNKEEVVILWPNNRAISWKHYFDDCPLKPGTKKGPPNALTFVNSESSSQRLFHMFLHLNARQTIFFPFRKHPIPPEILIFHKKKSAVLALNFMGGFVLFSTIPREQIVRVVHSRCLWEKSSWKQVTHDFSKHSQPLINISH